MNVSFALLEMLEFLIGLGDTMINTSRLDEILAEYKKVFVSELWNEEKYKWEAVKCFQDNWDINAADFHEMLNKSLSKTMNLLMSANNFPT